MLGLINTTLLLLQEHAFEVHDLSMASGSQVNTTFITCGRYAGSHDNSNNRTDKILLHSIVTDAQQALFKNAGYQVKRDVEVTEVSALDARADQFRMFIEISCKDEPGLLADITTLLRTAFSIDTMTVRQSWTRPRLPGGGKLKNIALNVTPLLALSQEPPIRDILARKTASEHFIRFDRSIDGMRERRLSRLQNGQQRDEIQLQNLRTDSIIGTMTYLWPRPLANPRIQERAKNARSLVRAVKSLVRSTHDLLMILNHHAKYDFAVKPVASSYPNTDGLPICLNLKGNPVNGGPTANFEWNVEGDWLKEPKRYQPRLTWRNPNLT
jgi:hypothetical protein